MNVNKWLKANKLNNYEHHSLQSLNYWTPLTSQVEALADPVRPEQPNEN